MNKFKVGDLVRCIDNKVQEFTLSYNKIYKVVKICYSPIGIDMIIIKDNFNKMQEFYQRRFIKINVLKIKIKLIKDVFI